MMRSSLVVVFALAALMAFSPDQASAKTVSLTPSSSWIADFGDEKCRLSRMFGKGDDQHMLYFEQYAPSGRVGFTVAGPAFKGFRERSVSLNFGPQQKPRTTTPYIGSIDGLGKAAIYSGIRLNVPKKGDKTKRSSKLPQLDFAALRGVDSITLKQAHREIVITTGDLHDPIKVLNHCAQNLLRVWGLDPEEQLKMSRPVKLLDAQSVRDRIERFYPKGALRRGEQGIARIRGIVDETGALSECKVNNATLLDTLEPNACKVLGNATFEPALDAERQPMRSYFYSSVRYIID